MISELDKNILKRILSSDKPVSGALLASVLHISINTLRKEILIINDYLEPYRCQIETKISIGYSLNILDETIAQPFLHQLYKNINRFSYLDIEDSTKENFIIRKVLCSSSAISIYNLMDSLNCSKSTILRLLDKTKEYLSLFHLEIKVKRNSGIFIEGTEWDKRMCLINEHKIYKHEYETEPNQDFDVLFLNNTSYPEEIRTILLSNIPSYRALAYAHIDIPIITNFIILLKTRLAYSKELTFSCKQIEESQKSITYNLTLDIVHALPKYFSEDFDTIQIQALNILLSGLRKYKSDEKLEKNDYIRIKKIVDEMREFITSRYEISHLIDETTIENMILFIKEQENINLFHIYKDAEFFDITNRIGLITSDLTALIAYFLHTQYNLSIGFNALSKIYSIINYSLYENNESCYKQRVLVISRYSSYVASNIAVRLKSQFSRYIRSLKIIEYTDIPLIDVYKYDVIFTDISSGLVSINLPVVEIEFNRDENDFIQVENYFNSLYLKPALEIFTKQDFYHVVMNEKTDLYRRIYNDLNLNDISLKDWIKDIETRESYLTFERKNEIILITNLLYQTEKPVFKLYSNTGNLFFEREYARIIIYYNHGDGSSTDIQNISYLNKQFIHSDEQALSELENLSYEEIIAKFTLPKFH